MLILTLFFALIMLQIGKDIVEDGISIYQRPRFWAHVFTMLLITAVATLN